MIRKLRHSRAKIKNRIVRKESEIMKRKELTKKTSEN